MQLDLGSSKSMEFHQHGVELNVFIPERTTEKECTLDMYSCEDLLRDAVVGRALTGNNRRTNAPSDAPSVSFSPSVSVSPSAGPTATPVPTVSPTKAPCTPLDSDRCKATCVWPCRCGGTGIQVFLAPNNERDCLDAEDVEDKCDAGEVCGC